LDEKTDIGPLATEQILNDLEQQVSHSTMAGAKILTGGQRMKLDGDLARGHFYEPTVLADIPKEAPAYCDELFRPVASLFRISTIDEAIELANATTFGLGSAAWTNDRRSSSDSSMTRSRLCLSSTAWSRPIRVCRSAASSIRVTVAN
jgi:succinate-semialdehyde dehydrogenase/glutarate-semialdehyde dehydrogenase